MTQEGIIKNKYISSPFLLKYLEPQVFQPFLKWAGTCRRFHAWKKQYFTRRTECQLRKDVSKPSADKQRYPTSFLVTKVQ
jgi:hypothetical protein